jgi:hypothetical protein
MAGERWLGLATVYGIVTGPWRHDPGLREKGHGTSFHIYFPASEGMAAKEKERVMTEERRSVKETGAHRGR